MNMVNETAALIPAYNPERNLVQIVNGLLQQGFQDIVVVNDGSDPACSALFGELKQMSQVHLLQHAVNLGKGAALKTGLNYIYCELPQVKGVVTLDADGQHLPADAARLAAELLLSPETLLLGARSFSAGIPLRSRVGNVLTKLAFQALVGTKLTDTQTGLRGIPLDLVPILLKIPSNGYEFELDMLLACKYTQRPIREIPISTIYLEGNASSHFNPLLDSMKIYVVLFRFLFTSLITAAIDYTVFYSLYRSGSSVLLSQGAARACAMLFNYSAVKNVVFLSRRRHRETLPRYVLLVVLSGTVSYFLITSLTSALEVPVIAAKACAEGLIFLVNFAIQRDFIFSRKAQGAGTDWNDYYANPYKTASVTRRITGNLLIGLIKKYSPKPDKGLAIAELGGANSCFFDAIMKRVDPNQYHVYDNNLVGLGKMEKRVRAHDRLFLHAQDVLTLPEINQYDLVFSVGLIEHFNEHDTKSAILAHFKLLKPGGVAIISFPTPTLLYRGSRWVAEVTNSWIFHDERPLRRSEVVPTLQSVGTVAFEKLNWIIFFTQRVMVVRKNLQ
jgi:glycosyltransferase involved in cell wall biosynthesis/SAM-dependent methyltransferase